MPAPSDSPSGILPIRGNKYEGNAEQWEEAQRVMGNILDHLGVSYEIGIDEAAFYGPKLDIQYKNVFGKEDTLVTIQIDMLLAKRFGMYYTIRMVRRSCRISFTEPLLAAMSGHWHICWSILQELCRCGWHQNR